MRFIERIHHSFRGHLNLQELRASWVASGAAGLAVASLIAVLEYTQGTLSEGPRSTTSGLVAMIISLVVVQLKQIKQGVPMPPTNEANKRA